MIFLLLKVYPADYQKISAVYKGKMREVVLSETCNYSSTGPSGEICIHQGGATFDLQSSEDLHPKSYFLIFEQKSCETAANQQMVSYLTELSEKQVAADVNFVVKTLL